MEANPTKKVILGILALGVAAILYTGLTLDSRVKNHIEQTMSVLTGVAVTIDSVKLSLFDGSGEVNGLKIPNPEGYGEGNAISMEAIRVSLDSSTIFSQPLIVTSLLFVSPEVNLKLKEGFPSNLEEIVEVSNRQIGISNKKKKKKSAGNSANTDGEPVDDEAAQLAAGQDEAGGGNGPGDEDDTYSMIFKDIRFTNVTVNAESGDKRWTETIDRVKIRGIGEEQAIDTRTLGIMIVRSLAGNVN
jgi:hypothetical protein